MSVATADNRYLKVGAPGSRLFVTKQPQEKYLIRISLADFLASGIAPPGAPTAVAITSISAADPASVQATAHGLSVNDIVTIEGSNAKDTNNVLVDGVYSVISVTDANNFTIGFNNTGGTAGGAQGTVRKGGLYAQGCSRIYKGTLASPAVWTTTTPHGLAVGDTVIMTSPSGTPAVTQSTVYTVAAGSLTATTFTCTGLNASAAHRSGGWVNRGITDQGANSPYLTMKANNYQELVFSLEGGAATPGNWNSGASGYPAGTGAIPLTVVRYKANGTVDEVRRVVLVVQLVAIAAAPNSGAYTDDRVLVIGGLGNIPRIKFDPNEVKDLTLDLSAWLGDNYVAGTSPNIPAASPTFTGSGGTVFSAPTQLTNTGTYARYRVTAPATAGWVGLMTVDLITNQNLLSEEIKRVQLQLEVVDNA